MQQQEQQGNGLVGGGIGLVSGGILAARTGDSVGLKVSKYLSGESPNIFRVDPEAIDREMWNTPKEQWQQTTDMLNRPRPVTPHDEYTARMREANNKKYASQEAYNAWDNKFDNTRRTAKLFYQLGVPITAALLGSTLTD